MTHIEATDNLSRLKISLELLGNNGFGSLDPVIKDILKSTSDILINPESVSLAPKASALLIVSVLLPPTLSVFGAEYTKKGRKITHIKFEFLEDSQAQLNF